MQTSRLAVHMSDFHLPAGMAMDATVAIPTVKGTWLMKYGEHAYYFMNFRTAKGLRIRISHRDILRPGWDRLKRAAAKHSIPVSPLQCFSPRYHYGFNLLEQIMLMTVPHTVTPIGSGRFIVSLWSWCGYLVVDCGKGTVTHHTVDAADEDYVLGSRQWFDPQSGSVYSMAYSLSDSLARIGRPSLPVAFSIIRHNVEGSGGETVWSGALSDSMHDIVVDRTRRYCVACELGMHLDEEGNIRPSKVLVVDLKNGGHWVLDRFIVAAHACFDPDDPGAVYFSNHNFEFQHSNIFQLARKGSYCVRFRGPASIFKYALTPEGPREIGAFTRPDFYRLTNMHAFRHRGRKVIAAMGFPDEVFLIDANDMSFIRKILVRDPASFKRCYSKKPALIGTICPSPDGEKLFVQTTGSLQAVDIDTGASECVRDYFFSHACFNHMVASADTAWGHGKGA